MAGPSSELMALSLALAPTFWQCLGLLAEAVFPSWHACRALFSCGRRNGALSTLSSVHWSRACHDREAAVYGCPSTTWTGWNRAEQPFFSNARNCWRGQETMMASAHGPLIFPVLPRAACGGWEMEGKPHNHHSDFPMCRTCLGEWQKLQLLHKPQLNVFTKKTT